MAHRAGINRNYVGLLERAANSPTLDTIERLAQELAVDPVRFFCPSSEHSAQLAA
ncbi:helix-turn-helix domain-containing protein [Novosphingobium sp. CECT 9465]|uniref:helix-turn-helix domain-containing protein n=1 Tax=Novosphingobium sp. CECT 9465 TaxID=2829794 RepID=UPI001E49AC5D|nr:helix-turn-helix transcriptional regulator [Novosphingobium sp. CECT 9465]